MSSVLAQTLLILDQTFGRTHEILNESNVEGSFELKMCVYRNYDSPAELLLEKTSFENRPGNIQSFLKTVTANGGWGNEAIEVFYNHVNSLQKVDQVILIGDAAANSLREVRNKREYRGESYWNGNNFPFMNEDEEIAKIIDKKIPIHSFYIAKQNYFKEVSKKTGGLS